jgi:hypothetical protein
VLLRAQVTEADEVGGPGRLAARMRVVDDGSQVLWHFGDSTTSWTLPDQPPQPGIPVLTSVVRAETWRRGQRGVMIPETYLLLVAADGVPLARLARVSTFDHHLYSDTDLERIWPDAVFEPLLERGVQRRTESFTDVAELQLAHPGAVPPSRGVVLSGRRVAAGWVFGLVLIVVVLIVGRHR